MTVLFVKKISETATIPKKGTKNSAGYDIYASEETIILAGKTTKIKTGISIKTPKGTYGRIAPRSGLASRYSLDVGGGVIDPDYTGEIIIIMFNHGEHDFLIKVGDRIAQLILERYDDAEIIETDQLNITERGTRGFGSIGMI